MYALADNGTGAVERRLRVMRMRRQQSQVRISVGSGSSYPLSVHLLIEQELKNGGDNRFAVSDPLEVCVTVEW
jgi:hypothetical protein